MRFAMISSDKTSRAHRIPLRKRVSTLASRHSGPSLPARCPAALCQPALRRKLTELEAENRRLRRLVVTDDLTGIFDRRYFAKRLREALHAPQRGLGVALCLFDLDDFKAINDSLGHAAGDCLLHAVAQVVKLQLRRNDDCVCRVGGDEFAAIYSADSPEKAPRQAEGLMSAIRQLNWGQTGAVSATFGLVWLPPGVMVDWQHAYARADDALYRAKHREKGGITLLDAAQAV